MKERKPSKMTGLPEPQPLTATVPAENAAPQTPETKAKQAPEQASAAAVVRSAAAVPTESGAPEAPEREAEKRKKQSFSSRMLESHAVDADKKSRKALMKKFRKAKHIPSSEDVERFDPSPDRGLSAEQVETRFSQLLFNDVNKKYSKSYASIFVGNICTFFNLLCLIVALALLYAQAEFGQFLFVAIFGANLLIGIIQEILAKKQIDKLSVLISASAKAVRDGIKTEIPVREIVLDDILLLETGQQVPADCILLDGNPEVNESLLTGESVPVKKAPGDMLYAGSYLASGACRVRADKVGRATYLNSLTSKAKKYKKPRSEIMNSIRLFIRIIGILIPLVAAAMFYVNWQATDADISHTIQYTCAVVIGMIPSGLLLLTSFAMAVGVMRLAKKQTLVQDLYSLEMLARVNVLCLDKTGTITDGRMTVNDCMILNNYTDHSLEEIMSNMLSALDDNNQTSIALYNRFGHANTMQATAVIPFSSKRKLSAVTFGETGTFAMGAPEFVLRPMPAKIDKIVKQYAAAGLRVLLLAYSPNPISGERLPSLFRPVAIITLADNIRADAIETIKWFRDNDVEIKIISGDNPVTVSEVARRVGVQNAGQYISLDGLTDLEVENVATQYTVFGRVTPEQKAILVRTLKKQGSTVAMTGDGVNDILALKEADCAVSVASGSEAARNVSHLVLMDNNFLNLPNVVYEGRRVINNIKSSAALYITKTLFTVLLATFCFILGEQYLFTTNNMLLYETLVTALPSVILALQPNGERVKGKFIPFVLSRSIPGALTLILCIVAVYVGVTVLPGEFDAFRIGVETSEGLKQFINPLFVLAVTAGGLVVLFRILKPFNLLRVAIYAVSVGVTILVLAVPFLGELVYTGWSSVTMSFTQVLYIVCIVLAAFPVSNILVKLCDLMNPSE